MIVVAQRVFKTGSLFTNFGHRESVITNLKRSSCYSVFFPGDFIREHTLPGIELTAYKCDFVKWELYLPPRVSLWIEWSNIQSDSYAQHVAWPWRLPILRCSLSPFGMTVQMAFNCFFSPFSQPHSCLVVNFYGLCFSEVTHIIPLSPTVTSLVWVFTSLTFPWSLSVIHSRGDCLVQHATRLPCARRWVKCKVWAVNKMDRALASPECLLYRDASIK